jgi:RsiW-degrading membrane proteinase PrsW (M82 family)
MTPERTPIANLIWQWLRRRPLAYALALAALIYLGVRLFAYQPLPADPLLRAQHLVAAGLPELAENAYAAGLSQAPDDVDAHYDYINNHFRIQSQPGAPRDDDAILAHYQALAATPATADLGHFGQGLVHSLEKNYDQAVDDFHQAQNRSLKYLNNSLGYALTRSGHLRQAEAYFWKEIDLQGNVQGATGNLIWNYFLENNLDRLQELADNPSTAAYFTYSDLRELALRRMDPNAYLNAVLLAPFAAISPQAAVSALLICATWFLYFWRIDVFEQEPWLASLITLLLGVGSAHLALALSDVVYQILPLSLSGHWLVDLVYSIVHIGLVEEVAKFLPVLLVVWFSRQVNEPVDLMIYGSLSALGFATMENALYFSDYGVEIAFSRFLISTVMHLAMTGIVCYAWAAARFFHWKSQLLAVPAGLLAAALVHGLFDYFLIGPLNGLSIVSSAILFLLSVLYGRMLQDTLNSSPFFRQPLPAASRLANYELLASTGVLLLVFIFVMDNFALSTDLAGQHVFDAAQQYFFTMLVVFGSLGEISILPFKFRRLLEPAGGAHPDIHE